MEIEKWDGKGKQIVKYDPAIRDHVHDHEHEHGYEYIDTQPMKSWLIRHLLLSYGLYPTDELLGGYINYLNRKIAWRNAMRFDRRDICRDCMELPLEHRLACTHLNPEDRWGVEDVHRLFE